jgi:hypothetical protein
MLISVHMPKAGGMSFRSLLETHYGKRFMHDYADLPINTPLDKRYAMALEGFEKSKKTLQWKFNHRKSDCIHGHFIPYKYAGLYGNKNIRFVTWLRDPLERLASHYHFWLRHYNAETTPGALHRKVVEENWTFEEFCFSKEMQNFYAQFLWRFPITQFDFVGITEHFGEDIQYFAKYFLGKLEINIPSTNQNPEKPTSYFEDKALVKKLKAFYAIDYDIYSTALKMRKSRL